MLSWEPRYLAGRLAATGSCCSFMMTLPSLSRGSHAEPTVSEGQAESRLGVINNTAVAATSPHSATVSSLFCFLSFTPAALSQSCTPQPTWSLHEVFLLAVAVATNVVEGEEKVMLFMQLSRQLYLYLEVRKTDSWGWFPNTEGALFTKMKVKIGCVASPLRTEMC